MEERRTDPRFIKLVLAVMIYIDSQSAPKNPFVKGFGNSKNDPQAYEFLVESFQDCSEIFPEVEAMLAELAVPEKE